MLEKLRRMFGRRESEKAEEGRIRGDLSAFIHSLDEEDWGVVTMLSGYWFKFGDESPSLSFIRAIQTLQFAKGSDPTMRASSTRTMTLAVEWAKAVGPEEAAKLGDSCVRLAMERPE